MQNCKDFALKVELKYTLGCARLEKVSSMQKSTGIYKNNDLTNLLSPNAFCVRIRFSASLVTCANKRIMLCTGVAKSL